MPVIRGISKTNPLGTDRRADLLVRLKEEFAGNTRPGGPTVFEIPLQQSTMFDVLAVWPEWAGVSAEDRTKIIEEALGERGQRVSLAMGVTPEEAVSEGLLPYRLIPTMPPGENGGPDAIRVALVAAGGIDVNGRVELRLPNLWMAKQVRRELAAALKLKESEISITETAGAIHDD